MSASVLAGPEVKVFRDVPTDRLETLRLLGERTLGSQAEVDLILQSSELPQPVLEISVSHVPTCDLPHIWMGIGMTEPGKGLMYVQDSKYYPRPSSPSIREEIPGLAIPVARDSISSVNFWPFAMDGHQTEVPDSWWEHWQRHSFTQKAGDFKKVLTFEDEIAFGNIFATWFEKTALEELFDTGVEVSTPIIVVSEPDSHEVELIPENAHGRYYDLRNKSAIFLGNRSIQEMLDDTARIAVPKQDAPEPFHEMMTTAAGELGLTYSQ